MGTTNRTCRHSHSFRPALHGSSDTPSSEPSREQIEALARDLPAPWAAKTTAQRDRKRLLRSLTADVTLTSDQHGPEVRVGIRWQSGAAAQHTIQRPQGIIRPTPPDALELITRHGPNRTNDQLAAELNAAGLRNGTERPVTRPP